MHELFSGCKYSKGKLVLLPLGTLQLMPAEKITKNQCAIKMAHVKDQVFVVQPWRVDFVKESGMFSPYWLMKEAAEMDDACMAKQVLKIDELLVTAYVNKKVIEKGTLLLLEPSETDASKKRKTVKK